MVVSEKMKKKSLRLNDQKKANLSTEKVTSQDSSKSRKKVTIKSEKLASEEKSSRLITSTNAIKTRNINVITSTEVAKTADPLEEDIKLEDFKDELQDLSKKVRIK